MKPELIDYGRGMNETTVCWTTDQPDFSPVRRARFIANAILVLATIVSLALAWVLRTTDWQTTSFVLTLAGGAGFFNLLGGGFR